MVVFAAFQSSSAVCCTSKEEEYPQIRIAGQSSPFEDLRYLLEDIRLWERQRSKEISMGRFYNSIILDNNSPKRVPTLCLSQSHVQISTQLMALLKELNWNNSKDG